MGSRAPDGRPAFPTPREIARCGPALPAAAPAHSPRYVVPGSHWVDASYAQIPRAANPWNGGWPFPRVPWPGESETRAPGTGLLFAVPCPPCPPPTLPVPQRRALWQTKR